MNPKAARLARQIRRLTVKGTPEQQEISRAQRVQLRRALGAMTHAERGRELGQWRRIRADLVRYAAEVAP